MITAGRSEAVLRGWSAENSGASPLGVTDTPLIMRVHAYGQEMERALMAIGGKPRYFGAGHLMAPVKINHANIPDELLRSQLSPADQLTIVELSGDANSLRRVGPRQLTLQ